jgi:Holliday junction resolvase RusA-like endonuclease
MLARVDGVELLTGPVAVDVAIFRARRAGDIDNFLKVTLDSMEGVFFNNDAQIRELCATLQDDKHRPRIEVSVRSCRGAG